jgi:uncharacterized protein YukJ
MEQPQSHCMRVRAHRALTDASAWSNMPTRRETEGAMPLKKYGVLVGSVVDRRLASGKNPHYQIRVVDHSTDYRIAVNVQSQDGSLVEYVVKPRFQHPMLDELTRLDFGFHALSARPNSGAIDFIRGNLVHRDEFIPLPLSAPGPDNDLNEKIGLCIERAMGDESAVMYAFGEPWGPENVKDKIFGFSPGNGIHDIHMNQGNDSRFANDDGVYQDGALILHYPSADEWIGVFMKFQTQSWHTDDQTGHALPGPVPDPVPPPDGGDPVPTPTPSDPAGLIQIVAALVNDRSTPERETVTLLNTTPSAIDLAGWSLADKAKCKTLLTGTLAGGQTKAFVVQTPMVLSNKGGIITVLNADGLKVDGVSYTKEQVSRPGWTVKF